MKFMPICCHSDAKYWFYSLCFTSIFNVKRYTLDKCYHKWLNELNLNSTFKSYLKPVVGLKSLSLLNKTAFFFFFHKEETYICNLNTIYVDFGNLFAVLAFSFT